MLKVRFKDTGLRKIETGQYALEDTRRKQGLKLTEPWTKIVRPGQHISMSMIFRLHELPTTKCPSCGKENRGSNAEEIQWLVTDSDIFIKWLMGDNLVVISRAV